MVAGVTPLAPVAVTTTPPCKTPCRVTGVLLPGLSTVEAGPSGCCPRWSPPQGVLCMHGLM